MDNEERNRFIESWGSMGILWGINRSMARIHAYLMVSEEPVDSEKISNYLSISRGNTSMCLKELRNWGVVLRVNISGDRRDFYITESDTWRMLYRIALNRKLREFDPALNSLRHLLAEADMNGSDNVLERLTQVEEILATIDHIMTRFLESESSSRAMLNFVKTMAPK